MTDVIEKMASAISEVHNHPTTRTEAKAAAEVLLDEFHKCVLNNTVESEFVEERILSAIETFAADNGIKLGEKP